ncbi:N-acetyl-gamma-glutamyl-phosphate reductase [Porticoccus litoralis]|uniref:N-acetyl-gamma-glutamyl-phosphate reductase n=1 Tax=Porticoccus litoralis TaxID=434086 RepID=A0AAW8B4E7_9GAMM|nr:N-acetyl-gamma-glutamyl-phosphate reductase [Porticoccus litoralis]MDP1520614.1 N-acetyl-gamma-glutamyl-phosphate reductase [Porticoccus litoralis]TNE89702.1 MAG: N-acetyl-gamma-glutamyl-phosphate reductase [Gammaproteobacteria bacterium]
MIKAGIVGGTGYTGVELLRLLAVHPDVEVCAITSRGEAGRPVADLFPNLRGHYDLCFTDPASGELDKCDVVFFATPHGVAQSTVPGLLAKGIKVIDLSADFRIRDVALWEQWYKQPHACPELVDEAVYGLPELNRDKIREARLIACPGCYPTSVLLGFLPLLEQGIIDASDLIANSASGASGAGRQASIGTLLTEAGESFKAYATAGHRHLPEITQGLQDIAGGKVSVTFVPHLLPIVRGIHSTLYATLSNKDVDLQSLYEERYRDEPFVDVMPAGSQPETRSVKGGNTCRISVFRPQDGDKVVVLVVEDNLVKGASGQAIQNMNILFGLPENAGLMAPALLP